MKEAKASIKEVHCGIPVIEREYSGKEDEELQKYGRKV